MGVSDTPAPLKPADRSRAVAKNAGFQVGVQVSTTVISFLLTPFILTSLGLELFGVWAFIGAGLSFVLLLSLGLGRSATRFIAVVSESGDIESVRRIVSYSVLSHACVGLVLVAVAYGTARALLPHTTVPEHQQSLAQTIFVLMACVPAFGFMLRPFASLIIGLERIVDHGGDQPGWAGGIRGYRHCPPEPGCRTLRPGRRLSSARHCAGRGPPDFVARRLIGRVFGNPLALDRSLARQMLRFAGPDPGDDDLSRGRASGCSAPAGRLGQRRHSRCVRRRHATCAAGPRASHGIARAPHAGRGRSACTRRREGGSARLMLQGSRVVALFTLGAAGFIIALAPLIIVVWLGRSVRQHSRRL